MSPGEFLAVIAAYAAFIYAFFALFISPTYIVLSWVMVVCGKTFLRK